MAERIEPCEGFLQNHCVAVRLEHTILVFWNATPMGAESEIFTEHEIWTYNLWTEHWKEHTLSGQIRAKDSVTISKRGVVIGLDVYMFAQHRKDSICVMWKLTRCNNGSFAATTIPLVQKPHNSQRTNHCTCDWEHGHKLWIFERLSDALLCCDPSDQTISSVICSGSIPAPQSSASAAVIKDKVWLCGGGVADFALYELDMHSFAWTWIQSHTGMPRPLRNIYIGSLMPAQDNQLVLHGEMWLGPGQLEPTIDHTWIFDVESHTWRTHFEQDSRSDYSGMTGLNGDVILLGGKTSGSALYDYIHIYEPLVNVTLHPRSLQQLAMRIVYENRTGLTWKSLPPKLIHKMMDTRTE